MSNNPKIKITKDGPYIVTGKIPLAKEIIVCDNKNIPIKWEKGEEYSMRESYTLCRCGKTKNPPFCDGTHTEIKFDGTETANRKSYYEQAEITEGPELDLADVVRLCASARFCDKSIGTWRLTERSNNPKFKSLAIETANNCPSGRLVIIDKKTDKPIEPDFEPSISLVEDPHSITSGSIWVKGCVPIESADGTLYETRNRVTLCRCGKSDNKPFCNGAHITAKYNDGVKSIQREKDNKKF
jgi:CDGSH-type Zn-finger protein